MNPPVASRERAEPRGYPGTAPFPAELGLEPPPPLSPGEEQRSAAPGRPAAPPPAEAPARVPWTAMLPGRQASLVLLGVAVLGSISYGGYFWYGGQDMSHGETVLPPQAAATATAAPPPPAPAAPQDSPAAEAPPLPSREAPWPEHLQAPVPPPEPPEPPEPPASIRLSPSRPLVHPGLEQAYAALQRDDLAMAGREYATVRQDDPHNTDALLGLAAIAFRRGQEGLAESFQQQALEADPRHPVAASRLLARLGESDPAAAESRLKGLIADQPAAPHPHFALGNLYARQGRWSEARQAYWQALAEDGGNPDYHFNLAVSLDHLGQREAARHYYRSALEAAAGRPAAFDRDTLRQRLQELAAP